MPSPIAFAFKQLVRLKFMSFQLKVPFNWQHPVGDALQAYNTAFKDNEKSVPPGFPPLFLPATMNKVHVDTQKMHIDKIGTFIDDMVDSICSAWSMWQSTASLTGVMVMGPVATMGSIVAPPIDGLILTNMTPKATSPMLMKYAKAIAKAIGTGWSTWQTSFKIPGLPMFPAFAAWALAVAPPMPSIPFPLLAMTQVSTMLGMQALKAAMIQELSDVEAPFHAKLFEAFADGFEKTFMLWQASTLVTNILGTGPVPTWAPPLVPMGPVVGGTGMGAPGFLK